MSKTTFKLSTIEKRATFSLASIFAMRMLGLFMIIPVFSLYAHDLKHVTPFLLGLALGCYGLTQATFQIPFGFLSDKYGRKRIIALGLTIFAIGSIVAALSTSIWGVILGRCLQGAGAIGSTTIALLADLTSEENRSKAMAVMGISIGTTFSLAMILGPILNSVINVTGIFWLTAVLACVALWLLFQCVPSPSKIIIHPELETTQKALPKVLHSKQLLRLDFGILLLHMILTATFVAIPITLEKQAGIIENKQWLIYFPVLIIASALVFPLIRGLEKKPAANTFLPATIGLGTAELLIWFFQHSVIGIAIGLFLFFLTFTLLEALLPSSISKIAPKNNRGGAIGIYSTCQFLGMFLGGSLGGFLYSHFSLSSIFPVCGVLSGILLLSLCCIK